MRRRPSPKNSLHFTQKQSKTAGSDRGWLGLPKASGRPQVLESALTSQNEKSVRSPPPARWLVSRSEERTLACRNRPRTLKGFRKTDQLIGAGSGFEGIAPSAEYPPSK